MTFSLWSTGCVRICNLVWKQACVYIYTESGSTEKFWMCVGCIVFYFLPSIMRVMNLNLI